MTWPSPLPHDHPSHPHRVPPRPCGVYARRHRARDSGIGSGVATTSRSTIGRLRVDPSLRVTRRWWATPIRCRGQRSVTTRDAAGWGRRVLLQPFVTELDQIGYVAGVVPHVDRFVGDLRNALGRCPLRLDAALYRNPPSPNSISPLTQAISRTSSRRDGRRASALCSVCRSGRAHEEPRLPRGDRPSSPELASGSDRSALAEPARRSRISDHWTSGAVAREVAVVVRPLRHRRTGRCQPHHRSRGDGLGTRAGLHAGERLRRAIGASPTSRSVTLMAHWYVLDRLQDAPQQDLADLRRANRRLIEQTYNWDRFTKVVEAAVCGEGATPRAVPVTTQVWATARWWATGWAPSNRAGAAAGGREPRPPSSRLAPLAGGVLAEEPLAEGPGEPQGVREVGTGPGQPVAGRPCG